MTDTITPLILTYNEAPNLERSLARLTWAKQVLILDSRSNDATHEIASRFKNVQWLERSFDDHTSQWNFGVQSVQTEWVLALDADYILEIGFEDELATLKPASAIDAFFSEFRYLVSGKALRACLYPPRAVLFRKDRCRYVQDGHTQLLSIPGASAQLHSKIDHDDRKPLSRWLSSQLRYAEIEAAHLEAANAAQLSVQDRLRKLIIVAPPLTVFYCLLYKGLILDGWRGWYYTWQRVLAEIILSLCLLENKFKESAHP
jgi:glycosyltransferase involved in cell wall biosynthesis